MAKYVKPIGGNAEIKKDNGDTIVVDIEKALELHNNLQKISKSLGFPQLFLKKDNIHTDASLVDLVGYQNGYITVCTKEHASEEHKLLMLLIPEKVYTGESTVFDMFRELLNNMMEKLKALEFEEYAAEIID